MEERAALVTGGSSGIGFAIAEMLRDEGFALTLVSRRAEKLAPAATRLGALAVAANVSVEEDCVRAVAAHRDRHGRLDVLVNSAGIGIAAGIEQIETKHLDLQLGVNLRGLIIVTREAMPMLRASGGLVVNLASIAGTAGVPVLPVYAATKAAVINFTQSLNRGSEHDGIRACALCPGFVDTPMATYSGLAAEEMIQPEDCAEVVRMLLRLGPRARIPQIVMERVGEGFA